MPSFQRSCMELKSSPTATAIFENSGARPKRPRWFSSASRRQSSRRPIGLSKRPSTLTSIKAFACSGIRFSRSPKTRLFPGWARPGDDRARTPMKKATANERLRAIMERSSQWVNSKPGSSAVVPSARNWKRSSACHVMLPTRALPWFAWARVKTLPVSDQSPAIT